jgi:4-amino-4-deoxy-L-arabinose transferase-like glycosyltransferase
MPPRNGFDVTTLLIVTTLFLAVFLHFFRVDVLPMGLYIDEQSIGYNAYLITQTSADEHGVRWPLFFEAFGEYKSPIYIYTLAIFYRLFGYSEWTTRVVSASFWLGGSGLLYVLARRLFADGLTRLYLALCLAVTPWIFVLSRVAFDFMVVYALTALHLVTLHRGFEGNSPRFALLSGVSIGMCLYAYTAFRLLAPLQCALVLACYYGPRFKKESVAFALGAAATAVPYLLFALNHFEALTRRFDQITYLHTPTLSVLEKIGLFIKNYAGFFDPWFLMLFGDPNHRHHTGFGGQLLLSTVLLLCVVLVVRRKDSSDRFRVYLLAAMLASPIPAALTTGFHNGPRAFSTAIFAVLLSAYGIPAVPPVLARLAVVLAAVQAAVYVVLFHVAYPLESAYYFQNYGFKQSLAEALSHAPRRVILSDDGIATYINLRFFGSLAGTQVPLLVGKRSDAGPGDAWIYYDKSPARAEQYVLEMVPP